MNSSPDDRNDRPSEKPTQGPSPKSGAAPGVLDRALALVVFLRENCPWDADQTPESLIPHLLEETQEVVDAIQQQPSCA